MCPSIVVTPRSLSLGDHPALAPLRQAGFALVFPAPGAQPTPAQLARALPSSVGYLAGVEPIPAAVLACCTHLKVISRNGAGVDNIDLAAAARLGIAVETTPGANARGVAELTVALMLAGARHLPWSDAQLKAGQWKRRAGFELADKTLGVIGCGQVGKFVTGMALGLGMRVRASDPFPDPNFVPTGDFEWRALDETLRISDVVTLHCPPAARPLIDAAALKTMKPGAYLINTARAGLIDADAVLVALETGLLLGFATDVYDHEPPIVTPLLRHERVITMPHSGGFTAESIERAAAGAVQNLLKHLRAK